MTDGQDGSYSNKIATLISDEKIIRTDDNSVWDKILSNAATVAIVGIRKSEFGWALQLPNGSHAGVCEFVPAEARQAFFQIAKQLVRSENQNWYYLEPFIRCRVKY